MENRKADTVCDEGDRQLQETKRKSMLFGRTKSRHEYLEGKCTA